MCDVAWGCNHETASSVHRYGLACGKLVGKQHCCDPCRKEKKVIQTRDLQLNSFWFLYFSHTQLESTLKELQQSHKDKKQDLQNLDEEIRAIQPSTSEEGVLE